VYQNSFFSVESRGRSRCYKRGDPLRFFYAYNPPSNLRSVSRQTPKGHFRMAHLEAIAI